MATPAPLAKPLAVGLSSLTLQTSARGPRGRPIGDAAPSPRNDAVPDFLSRLEDCEKRDTERLSHRSACSSPPPSRRPTPPPLPIAEVRESSRKNSKKASPRVLAESPRNSARFNLSLADLPPPVSVERAGLTSARTKSTPRSGTRPRQTPTPRAPRAVRTPKGPEEPMVQGFPTFNKEAMLNAGAAAFKPPTFSLRLGDEAGVESPEL